MQLLLPLDNVKCVEAVMQAAQEMSVSVLLPQSGNPFLKKADTSLIRLSAEHGEEEEKTRLDARQQLPAWAPGCNPWTLCPLRLLTWLWPNPSSPQCTDFLWLLLTLRPGKSKVHPASYLPLTVATCQRSGRCLKTGHKYRGISQIPFQPFA